jgi:uncharacterized membrane protein
VPDEPERVKALIGKTVIVVVLAAASIVACGGVMYLVRHGAAGVHYGVFTGEPTDLRTLRGVLADVLHMTGRGVIQFGLVILVGAQVVRVALTMWLFAVKRDRAFVAISAAVLAVLLFSLLSGG